VTVVYQRTVANAAVSLLQASLKVQHDRSCWVPGFRLWARESFLFESVPLGYTLILEETEKGFPAAGFGIGGKPDFWIGGEGGLDRPVHIAILAKNRATVDAFHKAALAAGGKDNGAPGIRAHYHPDYYGAFVLDPEGHNIEAVCHAPA